MHPLLKQQNNVGLRQESSGQETICPNFLTRLAISENNPLDQMCNDRHLPLKCAAAITQGVVEDAQITKSPIPLKIFVSVLHLELPE